MPEHDTEQPTQDGDHRELAAVLALTATASAIHPEGAVLPTAADASPQENQS